MNSKPDETIFEAALALPPEKRATYLDQACGKDPQMRQRIEGLIQAHEKAGAFMAQPAVPRPGPTVRVSVPLTEKPGDKIGHYKLLQQVGEGGCGVVYMAEQQEPIKRRVAFKVIKLGMDTKAVIARFEAERQALALMDHPNIARVFDAGATETGRPYFVMELVRGIKITDYCDQNNLSTEQRLDLFMQVCHAIQHAHQKGIIHRDIKPSNILVTVNDGVPVPKVIDFGIAKATGGQQLTDKTLFTAFEQFIGTPAYMSPEQAEMTSLDIDTRSDIYALGVLLYELLTGHTPFDPKTLLSAGLDEMRRIIREQEPPRPSTRLSSLDAAEQTTVAKRRQSEPPRLIHQVRGDLDWIVMKCLEKDRTRRYETANSLATDIEHHLSQEPVLACPPSAAYRLGKFVRRYRLAVSAAALIVLALALGLSAAVLGLARARRAEAGEKAQRQEAQQNAARAEKLATTEQQQRQRAELLAEQNRQNLYVARINQARQVFEEGDIARMQQLLDSLRPKAGESDLRGFEWYYLWHLCHSERHNLDGHAGWVRCVAFSPDGSTLASAGDDGAIHFWDTRTGKPQGSWGEQANRTTSIAYSPDGKILAQGSDDKTVTLWEVATGKVLQTLRGHTNRVTAVAFTPRGDLLASASGSVGTGAGNPSTRFESEGQVNGEVRIWDLTTMREQAAWAGHPGGIFSLAFSPDGKRLASGGGASADVSGGGNGSIKLWDVRSGNETATLTNFIGAIFAVAFSPDGRTLAAASGRPHVRAGEIRLWDTIDLKERSFSKESCSATFAVAFASDSRSLVSAGMDQIIRIWDVASGRERRSFRGHKGFIWSVAFSPDGGLLASAGWGGELKLWDAAKRQTWELVPDNPGGFSLLFSPDSKRLISASPGVAICEAETGKRLFQGNPFGADLVLAISPDGNTLAAAGESKSNVIQLLDLNSFRVRSYFTGHTDKVQSLAFSRDGRTLVSGSRDKTIRVWRMPEGTPLACLAGHSGTVAGLIFAPDGKTLISGASEIKFWDAQRWAETRTLRETGGPLDLSPDGKLLVWGPRSSVIRVRAFPSLEEVTTCRGHKELIWNSAFSADSKTLATASWDGTVRLWHVATGQELLKFPTESGVAWDVAFSPDRRFLAFGSGSGRKPTVALLRSATPAEVEAADKLAAVGFDTMAAAPLPLPREELLNHIPPRDPQAPPQLIDLSDYYNGSLTYGWIPSSQSGTTSGRNLGTLRRGLQEFAGTPFDVRGLVQLSGGAVKWLGAKYPDEVKGIKVARACRELHFLHGTAWRVEEGTQIGSYTMHYLDGQAVEFPLVYGRELRDWFFSADEPTPGSTVAWMGLNRASQALGLRLRIYMTTWRNPRPDSVIQSIDYASAMTNSCPFLIAITAGESPLASADSARQVNTPAASREGAPPAEAVQVTAPATNQAPAPSPYPSTTGIAPRQLKTPPELVDLSRFYNADPDTGWTDGNAANSLATLPKGLQKLGQTSFDVRGLIQLSGSKAGTRVFPPEVRGVKVGTSCRRIHFLHAASMSWGTSWDTPIAKIIVHSKGTGQIEIPVRFGSDVRDWQVHPKQQPSGSDPASIAWKGTNSAGVAIQLFKTTWDNPHPKVVVESLDYVSTMATAAPFLVAITTEP